MTPSEPKIAVVGLACRYPDADKPSDLLMNAIAQRRSFRKFPKERLSSSYFDTSGRFPDRAYAQNASVLKNFAFDREAFRVPLPSFINTDMTHWLALTVATEAIEDIDFRKEGAGIDDEMVRVVVGNTLSGEFSRANLLRLRWPYVRKVVAKQLEESNINLSTKELTNWLQDLEVQYKSPFPVPNEDFLAGGLSNTIAGRICNHFDFNGGGYSVDGACASSLLAVTDACTALSNHDADMVLAGGVDLSLDPFEMVGFSRTMALARNEMFVYDENSQGFWPGEGCGFVALMRYEDALANCNKIYGVIRGWGVSSDGRGGLTRPEQKGQQIALKRCYDRAGYGIETVSYFEGHGTGTKVGDAVELAALTDSRREAGGTINRAVISSIKANIGHTKAAAGLASLIKTMKCIEERVLPPTTGCVDPHEIFAKNNDNIVPSQKPEIWQANGIPRRAGISAMGFGGINTHITVEEAPSLEREKTAPILSQNESWPHLGNLQDAEIFVFSHSSHADLCWTVQHVADLAIECSRSEFTDLAAELSKRAARGSLSTWRAGTAAKTPQELHDKLLKMLKLLDGFSKGLHLDKKEGIYILGDRKPGKIGLLCTGQGAPVRGHGGYGAKRFPAVQEIYDQGALSSYSSKDNTDYAQVAITLANLAGMKAFEQAGVKAELAVGHSLGELSALYWADVIPQETLVKLVQARGQAMVHRDAGSSGAMAAISLDHKATAAAIKAIENLYLANCNSSGQSVVSGHHEAVHAFVDRLHSEGIGAKVLKIKQAFHTPLMEKSASTFKGSLDGESFNSINGKVISTVTGTEMLPQASWQDYLSEQIVQPVRFQQAIEEAGELVDLFVEVGPGSILTQLVEDICDKPAMAMDVNGSSLMPYLNTVAAAFVLGCTEHVHDLFKDRFYRHFSWGVKSEFLKNPCEAEEEDIQFLDAEPALEATMESSDQKESNLDLREQLREALAQQIGLPSWSIQNTNRMLNDLHLNSLAVGRIVADVAASVGLPPLIDPAEFSNSSVDEIAQSLEKLHASNEGDSEASKCYIQGAKPWVRYFKTNYVPATAQEIAQEDVQGKWELDAPADMGQRQFWQDALSKLPDQGLLVLLDDCLEPAKTAEKLLTVCQRVLASSEGGKGFHLAVAQQTSVAEGFLKSFSQENPHITTTLLTVETALGEKALASACQVMANSQAGYSEFQLDSQGNLTTPILAPIDQSTEETILPVGDQDLVLITGGGKGIGAECAYQLAMQTGCALLIIGRSNPTEDEELSRNMLRLQNAKVRASYFRADVTDAKVVKNAIANTMAYWGMTDIAGIIHSAGVNQPKPVQSLQPTDIHHTLAAKVEGFKNLLTCVNPDKLKLLVSFSSIIGRIGLKGEADYAFANACLSRETEAFQAKHPNCQCRALEWSVWSGTGMGQRLGQMDALIKQGIAPITIDDGVSHFLHLISCCDYPVSLIVTSRFGNSNSPAGLAVEKPNFRFLSSIEVFYPEVELVAQSILTPESDPYLDDHMLDGNRIFPAALSLEALSEAIYYCAPELAKGKQLVFSQVRFIKPIIVPSSSKTAQGLTLRIAIVVDSKDHISCVIRCSDTNFQMNHMEASCELRASRTEVPARLVHHQGEVMGEGDVKEALYDSILFQKGRFQRVGSYSHVEAVNCAAQLQPTEGTTWFHSDDHENFTLGDPGLRDSMLHAVQACMPNKTLIPTSVKYIEVGYLDPKGNYRLEAIEIEDRGAELVFDLALFDKEGLPVETWYHAIFRKVGTPKNLRISSPVLLAPLLLRHIRPLYDDHSLVVQMTRETDRGKDREGQGRSHRPDGKPDQTKDGSYLSYSYCDGWKFHVQSKLAIACDLELVDWGQATNWPQLLGEERFQLVKLVEEIANEGQEEAATRIWTAIETIKKLGLPPHTGITVEPEITDNCLVFKADQAKIFSTASLQGQQAMYVALGVLNCT